MIVWADELNFEIDGQHYRLSWEPGELSKLVSTDECLILGKRPRMVDHIARQYGGRADIRRIVELGVFQGGSCALMAQLCDPEVLVAFDLAETPVIPLEHFIARHGLESAVLPKYGVDQGDIPRLLAILDTELAIPALDLVIDDASHRYRQSRLSFQGLFPLLRDHGRYVVEDWAWAHFAGDFWQENGGYFRDEPALTNLIVEIIMLAGSRSDLVRDVVISEDYVEVTRGPGHLESPMDLAQLYRTRGYPFRPLL